MSETLHNREGFSPSVTGLPIDTEVIFSNHKNVYKKRIEKRQTKLIARISFIKPFLKEGEKILLVTTGLSPMSFVEQFFMGWIIFYVKRSLFVFTNRRIFHIPTTPNFAYRNSIANIIYADCESINIKGRALVVRYKSGKKEQFYYVSERKKITALLGTISIEGVASQSPGRTHLCPRCIAELIEDKYVCPNCQLEFKNRSEGKRISILYPGGGYFYTGHWLLGIGDAITEAMLMVGVLIALVHALEGRKNSFGAFVILLVILVIEKIVSVYHSNHFIKEYIPTKKEIAPFAATQ